MCEILDKYKADWGALDGEQQTPLFQAVETGNLDLIKWLILEK